MYILYVKMSYILGFTCNAGKKENCDTRASIIELFICCIISVINRH